MNVEKKVIKMLKLVGFDKFGFAQIKYFKELEARYFEQEKKKFKTLFQVGNVDKKTFKNENIYKSAIVVLLPYKKFESKLNENIIYVSSSLSNFDYHVVLKNKLMVISDYLESMGYTAKIYVDNNELDERYLAYKAGLGFYGLNHLLINKDYGSYFFIGVILTNAIFNYGNPLNKKCAMCGKCLESCPNGAIKKSGDFNGNQCVSYITQKKILDECEKDLIGQCIIGCDKCMIICPHNNFVSHSNTSIEPLIDIYKYSSLSNKEFKRKYGKYAFSWRGKKIFERNLNIYKQKLAKKQKL